MSIEDTLLALIHAVKRNTEVLEKFYGQTQSTVPPVQATEYAAATYIELGTPAAEAKPKKAKTAKTSTPGATQPELDTAAPQQLPKVSRDVVDEAVKAFLIMPDGKPLVQAIIKKFAARLDDVDPNRYGELVETLDEARKAKLAADAQAEADEQDALDDL